MNTFGGEIYLFLLTLCSFKAILLFYTNISTNKKEIHLISYIIDNSPNNNVSQEINKINNAEKINEKKFGSNSNKNNGTKILEKYNNK